VTYFKETGAAPKNLLGGDTELQYYTTPSIAMPNNFSIHEVDYHGSLA